MKNGAIVVKIDADTGADAEKEALKKEETNYVQCLTNIDLVTCFFNMVLSGPIFGFIFPFFLYIVTLQLINLQW